MTFHVEFKPRALRDLKGVGSDTAHRILRKIETMQDGLAGDVRRLMSFTPEYRLRVGDYRVLFEIERDRIIIYRVRHRRTAYDR